MKTTGTIKKVLPVRVPKVHETGDKVFGKNSVTGIERDESQPFAE